MGRFAKTLFVLWLLWVQIFFYRNLLEKYAAGFEEIGLGGAARSALSFLNGFLSLIGVA